MKKNWFTTGLTAILCAVMLVTSVSAASIGGGTTTTAVNFRKGAGTDTGVISTLPSGTKVVVMGETNGWYKVVYNGTDGYLSGDYVSFAKQLSGSFGTGTVTATSVNFRSGAGIDAGIIGSLNTGAAVKVVGVNGSWYQAEYNGQTGYVSSDYVKLSGGSAAPAPAGNNGGSGSGAVKGDYVRMRSGPGTGYAILGTYNNGTALTINGTDSGWTKVTIGGVSGYIRSDYVSASGSSSQGGQTSQTGYINGMSVRMRSGPNTSSQILGVYDTGTEMTITGSSGNWYAVSYNGKTGYVCKDYMTTSKPGGSAPATATEGYIKGSSVRMRSGPGTGYSILGTYNNGTPLTITGTSGDWTSVTINGLKGYVNSAYVTTTKPAALSSGSGSAQGGTTAPSASSSKGEQIVETAKQFLGYPYVYGGMSPSGFDCSGFVGYVYKQNGYSLKRVASDIYYNNGVSVSKSELQAGDLVFFSNSSESVGHVGIFISGTQFIHASSSRVGVIISDLSSSYYLQHYVGAKRIITG